MEKARTVLGKRIQNYPRFFSDNCLNSLFVVASSKRDWSINEGYTHHGAHMTYTFDFKSTPLSYSDALEKLESDATFRQILHSAFKECQHPCYIWETVPVQQSTLHQTEFKIALIKANETGASTRNSTLMEFCRSEKTSIVKLNLSSNEMHVGPNLHKKCYKHISEFMRKAPEHIVDEFWIEVSRNVRGVLKELPRDYVCVSARPFNKLSWAFAAIDNKVQENIHEAFKKVKSTVDMWR